MLVYLIDGTYELFRAFYGTPSSQKNGHEIGASRTLLRSFAGFLREPGVTHVAVAFDTVIESFRNDLFAGYKTGEGIDPALWSQFPLAERVTRALGLVTWSMIDFETDDALATAAARFADDPRVEQIRITSPDKDFCQCVRGDRVVVYDRKKQLVTDKDFCQCVRGDRVVVYDRKKQLVTNEEAAKARLGVAPAQVPAFLALVGDTADGIPGIARWGEKGAAAVLNRYLTIDAIPENGDAWDVPVRGKAALATELNAARKEAALYQVLATLRTDVPLTETLDDLQWRGPNMAELKALCAELDAEDLLDRFTDTDLS